MLVIRLSRTGAKGERKFRIVVKQKRDRRDGKSIEDLGWYVKTAGENKESNFNVTIDKKRLDHWLSVGAKPSIVVSKILKI